MRRSTVMSFPFIECSLVFRSSFDAGKSFELAVDFYDLLEGIIQVKEII